MKDTQAEPSVSVYHSLFADDVDIKIRDLNAVCIGVGFFLAVLLCIQSEWPQWVHGGTRVRREEVDMLGSTFSDIWTIGSQVSFSPVDQ